MFDVTLAEQVVAERHGLWMPLAERNRGGAYTRDFDVDLHELLRDVSAAEMRPGDLVAVMDPNPLVERGVMYVPVGQVAVLGERVAVTWALTAPGHQHVQAAKLLEPGAVVTALWRRKQAVRVMHTRQVSERRVTTFPVHEVLTHLGLPADGQLPDGWWRHPAIADLVDANHGWVTVADVDGHTVNDGELL